LTWVRSVSGAAVTLYHVYSGEEWTVEADDIVVACGGRANNALYDELEGRVQELHLVGDAVAPRRILYATRDGNRVGRAL
jgi:hypothetical protein